MIGEQIAIVASKPSGRTISFVTPHFLQSEHGTPYTRILDLATGNLGLRNRIKRCHHGTRAWRSS